MNDFKGQPKTVRIGTNYLMMHQKNNSITRIPFHLGQCTFDTVPVGWHPEQLLSPHRMREYVYCFSCFNVLQCDLFCRPIIVLLSYSAKRSRIFLLSYSHPTEHKRDNLFLLGWKSAYHILIRDRTITQARLNGGKLFLLVYSDTK